MADIQIKVLMVEDNQNVLHLNRTILSRQGYVVYCAENLAEARDVISKNSDIDVAILDIVLPDGDGLTFAAEIKETAGCKVMMLTSKRQYCDIVQGLTSAADDYLTKPYRIEELNARLKALLMKRRCPAAEVVRKGSIVVDTLCSRAFLREEDMLLRPKEVAVLLMLMKRERQLVPMEEIFKAVWKLPANGDSSAVKTTISRLRKKLKDSGYTINVVRGAGYYFQSTESHASKK